MYSFYRFATVKMGIHLCYKWDKPKSMVKVVLLQSTVFSFELNYQPKSWINSIHLLRSV